MPSLFRDVIPISDIDPWTEKTIVGSHVSNGSLRELGPAVYLSRYDMIIITRHDEVKAMLGNWRIFSSTDTRFNTAKRDLPLIIVTEDPPAHTQSRAKLMQFFTPVQMKAVREAFERQAAETVANALARGEFVDGVEDIAKPFILAAFPDLLGLPKEGREKLLLFGEAVFNEAGPRDALYHAAIERCGPGFQWVAENTTREKVTPDGLAARTYALADAGEVTEPEAVLLVNAMLAAGFDTTIAAIGNALKAFSDFAGQWEQLHANPALAKQTFEESLRFDPPARMMHRVVMEDAEVAGIPFRKGDYVGLLLDSAGRDPLRWENAETFDITRKAPNLGFGHGPHQCLGQALARVEGEILLTELARRVKSIAPAGKATRLVNHQVSAWTSVPLRLTPA